MRKKVAFVSLGLVQSPAAGVGPLWHMSYAVKGPDGMPGRELFHVAIEGDSGKLSVLWSEQYRSGEEMLMVF